MYFRNKFNEEFLLLANNIEPKGGSVRLDQINGKRDKRNPISNPIIII